MECSLNRGSVMPISQPESPQVMTVDGLLFSLIYWPVCFFLQVRFILAVVEGRLKVNNRKKADILAELKTEGYDMFLPP